MVLLDKQITSPTKRIKDIAAVHEISKEIVVALLWVFELLLCYHLADFI